MLIHHCSKRLHHTLSKLQATNSFKLSQETSYGILLYLVCFVLCHSEEIQSVAFNLAASYIYKHCCVSMCVYSMHNFIWVCMCSPYTHTVLCDPVYACVSVFVCVFFLLD